MAPAQTSHTRKLTLRHRIEDSINVCSALLQDYILEEVVAATHVLVSALRRRSSVFFFGNGGSSSDAGHLAAELLGRFYWDRPPLPAFALADNTAAMTAIGNDYGYENVFSRQLQGLARPGDVAVGLSTSGNSQNVIRAFEYARSANVSTIAFTGATGGKLVDLADLVIRVPSEDTPRIQECHVLLGHTMCELVERELFSEANPAEEP
jgi:D-sedoheptulose 7-phosphate isomerase